MPDSGIVCLTANADIRFDYDAPYFCNKIGDPIWNDAWCNGQAEGDVSMPDCTVRDCCEFHLGAGDYNPVFGLEYTINNITTDEYYVCCNGGTTEIYGCLNPDAINYDVNATWDPLATGLDLYASCIFPYSVDEIVIKADDGIKVYEESFTVRMVEWVDNPLLDEPYETTVNEDEYIDLDLMRVVIRPDNLPSCNNATYNSDCLMFEIISSPSSGFLESTNIIFEAPFQELSWGDYPEVRYTPYSDFYGTDTFSYRVTDTSVTPNLSNEGEVNITIVGIGDPFVLYDHLVANNPIYVEGYNPKGSLKHKVT